MGTVPIFALLLIAASAFAADEPPGEKESPTEAEAPVTAEAQSSSEDIGPLDSWSVYVPEPEEEPAEEMPEEEETSAVATGAIAAPGERPALLKLSEEKRLQTAYAEQKRRVLRDLAARRRLNRVDPRGARELRLCAKNMHTFGSWVRLKKVAKDITLPHLRSTENDFLASAARAECDIIALQGLFAVDAQGAARLVSGLSDRLSRRVLKLHGRTDTYRGHFRWHEGQEMFSAYLVKDGAIVSFSLAILRSAELPQCEEWQGENAPRDILQLNVLVKSGDAARSFIFLNTDLRQGSLEVAAASELCLLRFAQGVREKSLALYREELLLDIDNPPVLVVIAERDRRQNDPVGFVLEGRLLADDFSEICTLEENAAAKGRQTKFSCTEDILRPADLVDVFRNRRPRYRPVARKEGEETVWRRVTKQSEKATAGAARRATTGIYLLPDDLPLVSEWNEPLRRALGIHSAPGNELRPLFWLDFNW